MFDIPFALYVEELEGRLDTPRGIQNKIEKERYNYDYRYDCDYEFDDEDEEFITEGYRYF